MIYFIRDPGTNLVKIGYSANAWARLSKIQSDSPGKLIIEAVIDGDKDDERALHDLFHRQRSRGEWFQWRGPIALHVAGLESIARPREEGRRDPVKTEINRALKRLGYGKAYACELHSARRPWPLRIAVAVWLECGHKIGPVAEATDEELKVLAKFAPLERGPVPVRDFAA